MKLYYFNPNTYGREAFVMAESPEKAKEYLLKQKRIDNHGMNTYHNEKIDNMVNLKDKYTLEEYNVGEVVFTEIC